MSIQPISKHFKKNFSELGVKDWIINQCKLMGIVEPTPVQCNCIPEILKGKDVIGCAKTGTGKTMAFAVPILQKLADDPHGIYALVLTPTRELAFQIADQFRVLGKAINLKDCVVVGGRDIIEQAKEITRRPHVLIATPGRLADHISNGEGMQLNRIKFLVLDEADRLLDGQYEAQLKTILNVLPAKRQTLLFSATITDALTQLQQVSVDKPFFYEDDLEVLTVDQLDQRYVLCPVDVKDAYLVYVVKKFHERHPDSSILIFSHTCHECQALTLMFRDLGLFQVAALHSMIRQQERLSSLTKFRSNRVKVLLCTDVAARGLDIPQVDLVVNHNVPQLPKGYVHRVGRAARAGRSGNAITFVTQYDIGLLQGIEKLIKCQLTEYKVNHKNVFQYVTQVLVAKREAEIKLDEQNFGEQKEINKRKQMILEGLDPDEVEKAVERQKKRRKEKSERKVKKLKLQTNAVD